MTPKASLIVLLLSLTMVFAGSKHHAKHAAARPAAAPSAMALGMDSMFVTIKQSFDEVAVSSVVKNQAVPPVNAYFFKALKEHQPFYSLTRVNAKGVVINEVIRLVDKTDIKPQNLSKEAWVKQTVKKHKEYSGMMKLEETGRYYLLWAAPVVDKDKKGKEVVEGAVALKIDLWDCFHKYANTSETPFLVRIGRLHLYSNKWKDSIGYKEDALSVAGGKSMFVRYPKVIVPVAAPAVAQAVAAPNAPAVDSARIKAAQDSVKAAQTAQLKQKQHKKNIITVAVIVLILLIAALLFMLVPMIKQRMVMGKIDKGDEL